MGELISLVLFVGGVAVVAWAASRVAARGSGPKVGLPWLPLNQPGMPFGMPAGLDPQFMAMMQQVQALLAQAQAGGLPPHLQGELLRKLAAANRQMGQLDGLRRQQHEAFMDDVASKAASAGIDISSLRGP